MRRDHVTTAYTLKEEFNSNSTINASNLADFESDGSKHTSAYSIFCTVAFFFREMPHN